MKLKPEHRFEFDLIKIGKLDEQGNVIELPKRLPGEVFFSSSFEEARLDSGLYRLQDIVNQSNVGFTVSAPLDEEALEVLTGELRRIQEWRKQLLEQIRLWVKTVHEGDLQPLISVLRFGAKHLPPEQLTTKYLEQKFLPTTDMWFALESSLTGKPEDIGTACQHILYLMMREADDNGSLSPDV
jgi:hypothetical protein